MKKFYFLLLSLLSLHAVAQTNLLSNGGFENFAGGFSGYMTTGNGNATGLSGQWQLAFVGNNYSTCSGASCGTTQADSVTAANSGTKSLQINITKHTNRNDIRLFQSIASIPAGNNFVVTFYMKSDVAGYPVTVNVFKSSEAINSNGTCDTSSYCQSYTTTTYWKQYKMYVNLSTWSSVQRTNMRISIRPNTTTAVPTGTYPKVFWFDDISFKLYDNLTELKEMAIQVAMDRKQLALDSGFTAEAASLTTDIATLNAATFSLPTAPAKAIGFNPPISVTSGNPYIDTLNAWAKLYLASSFVPYGKAEPSIFIFPSSSYAECRNLCKIVERLHWLLLSPYSNYQYSPELFRRLLFIVYATTDDYKVNGSLGGISETPGGTTSGMNDWFAAAGITYGWRMTDVSFGSFIPATLRQQMRDAADSAGRNFRYNAGNIDQGTYANRDVSYAEVLMHLGMYRNNQEWINFSKRIIDSMYQVALLPDGAYHYLEAQNETANYHGGNNNSLAKLWAVSEYQPAWDCLSKVANYEILCLEAPNIAEFYTAPAWKSQWNGSSGASGEPVLYVTQNPYFKTKLDQIKSIEGLMDNAASASFPLYASFYRNDITGKALPDNYVVYDRNIQGPRGRYGRYSYGITTRSVSPKSDDPGLLTLVGSMKTQAGNTPINSVLMLVHSKVHIRSTYPTQWNTWGYMMTKVDPRVCVSRTASAVSTPSVLQYQNAGPIGVETNWASYQQWITLPDRMIGFVETYPAKNVATQALEIDTRIRFTYGRNGTLDAKNIVINQPGYKYTYGSLQAIIHEHDFTTVDTATVGVLRDDPPIVATEIALSYNLSNKVNLYTYPATIKKYAVMEIRDSGAVGNATVTRSVNGNVKGLLVLLNGKAYATYRNLGATTATIDVSNVLISGNAVQAHFSRGDSLSTTPSINVTGNTLQLPAGEQVLIISSNDVNEMGKGWQNFTQLLNADGCTPGTWLGSNNADGNTANNWCAGVPDAVTNVLVNTTTPKLTNQLTVNNLSLLSGIDLNDKALTIVGNISGSGTIKGSPSSELIVQGIGTLNFDTGVPGFTNALNKLTINSSGTVSLGNTLHITGFLHPIAGTLALGNSNIVLKSIPAYTAQVGVVAGAINYTGSGRFVAERYINSNKRGYRNISSGGIVSDGSIFDNWQEGGSSPVGYGMHITGSAGNNAGINSTTGLDYTLTGNPSLWTYSNYDTFVRVANTKTPATNQLLPFVGYMGIVRGDRTYDLFSNAPALTKANTTLRTTGKLLTGQVTLSSNNNPVWAFSNSIASTFTLNNNTLSNNGDYSNYGYSLVANPYACTIDWNKVYNRSNTLSNNHLSQYYWIWSQSLNTNGGYVTLDKDGNNNTNTQNDKWIQPGQSFYIVNDHSGANIVLDFQETDKWTSDNSKLRGIFNNQSLPAMLRFGLSKMSDSNKMTFADGALVKLDSSFNNQVDIADAIKLTNPSENLAIDKNKALLAIESRNYPALTDTIQLKIWNISPDSVYQLSVNTNSLKTPLQMYLWDKLGNTKIILKKDTVNVIQFVPTTDSATYQHRFAIVFNNDETVLSTGFTGIGATRKDSVNTIRWSVANSNGISSFEIERSLNGKDFVSIGRQSISIASNNYLFKDDYLQTNTCFYRVKMIGVDARVTYSNTVQVAVAELQLVNVYPTVLAKGKRPLVQLKKAQLGGYQWILYSSNGQMVASGTIANTSNNATYELPISTKKIVAGMYQLQIQYLGKPIGKGIWLCWQN